MSHQPASQAAQFRTVLQRTGSGVFKRLRNDPRQKRERQNIQRIVFQHGLQLARLPGPQILKIQLRNQFSRYIPNALVPQDLPLQFDQAA